MNDVVIETGAPFLFFFFILLQEVPQPQSGWKIKRFVSTTTPHRTPTPSLCVFYTCVYLNPLQ